MSAGTESTPKRDLKALIAAMTLEERASLTAGADLWHTAAVPRLGIGTVRMTDGPNAARGLTNPLGESQTPSACIPCGSALGATWDPEIVKLASAVVARQARQKGAEVLLAPTINLHRHPLWGRNFEAFSEDPFLSGSLAIAYVEGVQDEGLAATAKHLVCNESEHERRTCSSDVDERTLRELYLLPFEMAVREGHVLAVMTAYNRLNGKHVADDRRVLTEILRGEWGFGGLVMTDWWALSNTADAGAAGLDIEMPGPGRSFGPGLAEAVRAGLVDEGELARKALRLLTVFDGLGALDGPTAPAEMGPEAAEDRPEDRETCRRAAAAAMVLLKNDGGLLPLRAAELRRVALIGPSAAKLSTFGGGSARARPYYSLSLQEALAGRLGSTNVACDPSGQALSSEELARWADVAIVVVGTDDVSESESYDRETMDLPGEQSDLVRRVLDANPRTVVVVNTGSPVVLPWAAAVPALLQCWFGGQELANALVDVLLGDAEPGGRLPVTFPLLLEHAPAHGSFPAESSSVRYSEGLLVGYRWYQARHLPSLFPFGHGLSYTSIKMTSARARGGPLGPAGRLTIEVELENTGPRQGSEVVQVYVAPPGGGRRAAGGRLRELKALKAFSKVHLLPGERKTAVVHLCERSFAYYDVADTEWPDLAPRAREEGASGLHRSEPGWYVDKGTYQIEIGRSCEEICHRLPVEVEGRVRPLPLDSPLR